jgi:hypothetical protein
MKCQTFFFVQSSNISESFSKEKKSFSTFRFKIFDEIFKRRHVTKHNDTEHNNDNVIMTLRLIIDIHFCETFSTPLLIKVLALLF